MKKKRKLFSLLHFSPKKLVQLEPKKGKGKGKTRTQLPRHPDAMTKVSKYRNATCTYISRVQRKNQQEKKKEVNGVSLQ